MSIVGVVGVVWFFLNVGEFDNWMYRGGFLVLALFAALLIAATVHPASRLAPKVFALPVVVWIGRALVRDLSLALADLHGHAPARRRPVHGHPAPRPAAWR